MPHVGRDGRVLRTIHEREAPRAGTNRLAAQCCEEGRRDVMDPANASLLPPLEWAADLGRRETTCRGLRRTRFMVPAPEKHPRARRRNSFVGLALWYLDCLVCQRNEPRLPSITFEAIDIIVAIEQRPGGTISPSTAISRFTRPTQYGASCRRSQAAPKFGRWLCMNWLAKARSLVLQIQIKTAQSRKTELPPKTLLRKALTRP